MQEYDGSTLFLYECGYSMGYELNIQLRPGERIWEEGGIEKRDVHIAREPHETYRITCESAPTMKSIVLRLAE
jgi:hypothetical protein